MPRRAVMLMPCYAPLFTLYVLAYADIAVLRCRRCYRYAMAPLVTLRRDASATLIIYTRCLRLIR